MSEQSQERTLVTLTIDGKEASVPEGTNLIEAARTVGIEIPHYCYHPHLSVPGNCRMCQVEVRGQPKLTIGCNTAVKEGMEVLTHLSSEAVRKTQAATLEFILINHPLDCTVCDQSGHCKLQDYHFEYNARPSRFLESKVRKAKAKPLGPEVILDGERCIMCTRCVRFCDEITKTSELGMFNRGDRSEIGVYEGRELNNALDATVVDLCPVGALTHRRWRFNTRIWFTREIDGICPGCSTGCNVKVASRDGQIVQVKARLNDNVNKEWLCNEGRYGFHRFLPENRVQAPSIEGRDAAWEELQGAVSRTLTGKVLVMLAPDLLLEEYDACQRYLKGLDAETTVVLAYRERQLNDVEKVLVSPDYAANFRGAQFAGLIEGDLEAQYTNALHEITKGAFDAVLMVGDHAIDAAAAADEQLWTEEVWGNTALVACISDADSVAATFARVRIPLSTILEKAGLLVNRYGWLQYTGQILGGRTPGRAVWRVLQLLSKSEISKAVTDRDRTVEYLRSESRLQGVTVAQIKDRGVQLDALTGDDAQRGSVAS